MSQWSTRWSIMWLRTRRIGSDSLLLVSKLSKSPSRGVLIAEAQQANSVATSLLRAERELNLVRYHGLFGYLGTKNIPRINSLVQKIGFSTSSSSSSSTASLQDDSKKPSEKPTTIARVAFMITASQRKELSEKLGFTADEIKRLKPIEASLILENDLHSHDASSKLPVIMKEYQDSLTAQRLVESREETVSLALQEPRETPDESASSHESNSILELKTRVWHEVVEVNGDSKETIGLFQTEDEAKLLQETKEELAAKYNPDDDVRFEVRETRK